MLEEQKNLFEGFIDTLAASIDARDKITLGHSNRVRIYAEIICEKLGLNIDVKEIKENSNTVIFEQTPDIDNVFINECNNKNNKLHIIKETDVSDYSFDNDFQHFNFKDMKKLKINQKLKMK